ncbi:MAG: carbohydrate ABC transporter permease [Fimbriimonadaceae bacterium]|nr:carbohydrate ABC transporter permease [Fimbriimonadaceae bacterium]
MPRSGRLKDLGVYVALGAFALTTLAPFAWMLLASLKPLAEVESANPVPTVWKFENYSAVAEQVPFGRYFANSVVVAGWVTLLTCLSSAMAAFAFSRLRWRGRDALFRLYLATLMIPGVVTMIPNYTLMVRLHLLDTYTGLIVPASFGAFGTFLLRQFMLGLPTALDEAARLDGATHWHVFWDVVLPLARPGVITLAIFAFLGNYGSFYWPLVMVKSPHMRTLPVGLLTFDTVYGRQTNLLMAAAAMSLVPPLLVFLFGQRFLVRGIQLGAVKG